MTNQSKFIVAIMSVVTSLFAVKLGVDMKNSRAKNKVATALGNRLAYFVNNVNSASRPARKTKMGYGVQPIIATREKKIFLVVGENVLVQPGEEQVVYSSPDVKWLQVEVDYNDYKVVVTWKEDDCLDDAINAFVDIVPNMVM